MEIEPAAVFEVFPGHHARSVGPTIYRRTAADRARP
jgi:hypothetical protein